ncbi:uncharacterized mitochondrial protein AtMg00810-like [Lycium barbarum]|uniref:uncharacterized mitochondrial protein AtMg00810-like n=1 Tax=Lycium barbarum TaxID=112863 RepID=UPI00293F2A51|nr:uncharacterized mitochondrial protein AtMg00810-like [Lycium barbarum]
MAAAKPAVTPVDANTKLTTKQHDDQFEDKPDIAFGVQTLSQFLQQPKKTYMDVAVRIVRYIKKDPGQGLLLSNIHKNEVATYYDVDWAACPLTRKSVTMFLIKVGDSLLSESSGEAKGSQGGSIESSVPISCTTQTQLEWEIVSEELTKLGGGKPNGITKY